MGWPSGGRLPACFRICSTNGTFTGPCPPQLSGGAPRFSELDKLVLDYPVGMTRSPAELSSKLRQHLDDGQLIELTHHIAMENMRGRFNLALGIAPPAPDHEAS